MTTQLLDSLALTVSKFRESFIILLVLFFLDTAEQLNVRRANNNNLDPVVMDNL